MSGISKMKSGVLADENVKKENALELPIPLNKTYYIAPRTNDKIFRPKKAKFMFDNLKLSKKEKKLLEDEYINKLNQNLPEIKLSKENTFAYDKDHIYTIPITTRPNISEAMFKEMLQSQNILKEELNEAEKKVKEVSGLLERKSILEKFNDLKPNEQKNFLKNLHTSILTIDPNLQTEYEEAGVNPFVTANIKSSEKRQDLMDFYLDLADDFSFEIEDIMSFEDILNLNTEVETKTEGETSVSNIAEGVPVPERTFVYFTKDEK